jgi:hypothetical protein
MRGPGGLFANLKERALGAWVTIAVTKQHGKRLELRAALAQL